MKFVVLGSGSSVPHPKRSSSAFWLECENGSILLDFSASAIHRIAQENLNWVNLDAIWISHFHLDHCGGLFPFLFGTKHAPETQNRTKPLRIFGAKGLRDLIERFNDYELLKQPFPVEILEIEAFDEFEILPDVKGFALKTPHTESSFAIRISEKEKSFVFTSDTGFCKPLVSFAKNVDLFVLECSFFKNKPVELHLELAEAMFLIHRAKPKKAVLTHFYAEWDEIDFVSEIEKFTPLCEIIEARDGLRLDL
ncbi:MAG TPA: ribonuclease Z [Pyrinomonadaceae bacterium]|nr:ribonuclease Z [Pyrinomonadaceae bacterium]